MRTFLHHPRVLITTLAAVLALSGCAVETEEVDSTESALSWHSEAQVANEAAYNEVTSFFKKNAERGSFISEIAKEHGDGAKPKIAYAIVRAKDEKGAIVVANGRTETFEQYAEFVWDMNSRGYSVYLIDHRGQGHSDRLLGFDKVGDSSYQKGHVDAFQDYVDDMHQFITTVVRPDRVGKRGKLFGVGHSMGGTIMTLYGMLHPKVLDRIALTSPMHELEVDQGFLFDLAVWWSGTSYAKGQGPRDAGDARFEGNPLTSSRARFNAKQAVWAKDSSLLVGGPTYLWVDRALNGAKRARESASRIEVPVLLMRPENDRILEPEGQKQVCNAINESKKGGSCRLVILRDSRHEPLIETDAIRSKTLRTMVDFFEE